jgi:thiol-disulfide isomerase/thioredoxin
MTRFRICVNPESRDTPRVHARRGKAFRILSLRGVHLHIVAAVFSPSAYADDEKEEGVTALAPEESSEFDGQKVTDFGLQARDGRMLDVRDFRGGPVIVEFFASGSPACRAQLEQLIKLHDGYADKGFAIFALAVDPFETPERLRMSNR